MRFQTPAHPHHPIQPDPTPPATAESQALTAWGLDPADSTEWITLDLPRTRDLVDRALTAQRGPISPAAYASWCIIRDWQPREAAAFLRAGFSEPEAAFARTLLTYAAFKRSGNLTVLTDAWLDCPLSPAWICRTLAIGITQPSSAHTLFVRSLGEPTLTRTIDINADFRGANNRDLVIDHAQLARFGVQRLDPSHQEPTPTSDHEPPMRPHSADIAWAVDDTAQPY